MELLVYHKLNLKVKFTQDNEKDNGCSSVN